MSWQLLVSPIASLLDKLVPDKTQRDKLAHEIATMAETHAHEIAKAQIKVNQQEAAHKSLFVAGWRPFTGWTCASALAFNYLIIPIVDMTIDRTIDPLDLTMMMPVLMGMLGLGAMRSYEKRNGVSRER